MVRPPSARPAHLSARPALRPLANSSPSLPLRAARREPRAQIKYYTYQLVYVTPQICVTLRFGYRILVSYTFVRFLWAEGVGRGFATG